MVEQVHIGWMIRDHLPAVLRIESLCFEFAWAKDDFDLCLRQRKCIGMVAKIDDEIIGYMIYELHKNRLEVLNFAVTPSHWREGVGRAMVEKLTAKLCPERRNRITLQVREKNLSAQLFFRECGFRAVQVLRDYYPDASEDAYLFQYRVDASKWCGDLRISNVERRCGSQPG